MADCRRGLSETSDCGQPIILPLGSLPPHNGRMTKHPPIVCSINTHLPKWSWQNLQGPGLTQQSTFAWTRDSVSILVK